MLELLLASMIFATVPALEAPVPTVYAESVEVVVTADHFVDSVKVVEDVNEDVDDINSVVDETEECIHGVYEDIIDLGGGNFVGTCECGVEVWWYESDGSDLVDDEEIPIELDEEESEVDEDDLS